MKWAGLLALAVLLAGCGRVVESRMAFDMQGDVQTLQPLLTVTATSGGWSRAVTGDDIVKAATSGYSAEYPTPRTGTLTVTATLQRPGEAPLATGSIQLDIRRDWVWGITVALTNQNPADLCFGCEESRAFAVPEGITTRSGDSLYVVWGGNWISHPVIY